MRTYTEELNLAKQYGINIAKLNIAHEVECVLFDYKKDFETLCELVYTMWLDTDAISVNALCNSIKDLLDKSGIKPSEIKFYEEHYNTIIDNACYIEGCY